MQGRAPVVVGYNVMPEPDAATDLIQRLKAGDGQAAEQLFALYARRLVRVAEQHLSPRLAGREDGAEGESA